MDPSDEEEIEASRKLLGAVRKQFASEKGLEAKRTISKSGDESQHDKKGAKEKALREKTQIEFFEREKIFANDDNQKTEGEQPEPNQFPVMNDRPALVRLTTVAPKKANRQPITVVSPEDQNNDNDKYNGMDFQSLHDLLLKRLKGWREKGYKITTELEIVQRGAVHDKVRSVRERGKGQQTFQRYERGNAIRGKTPSSYIRSSLGDQKIRHIEPLSANHNTDNDKMQLEVKENENKQTNQKNLFSNLPKFLLEPADYETELDGPEDKVQLSPHNHRQPLHQLQPMQTLPPHPHQHPHQNPHQYQFSQPQLHLSPHSIPHHHQQHHLQHTHSVLLPPPPEALKLQASPPSTGPKTVNLVSLNNTKGSNRPSKGKKYSFKGMTRKVTSEKRDEETIGKKQNVRDGKSVDQSNFKNGDKNKVSSSTTPISTLSESKEFTNNKGDQSKSASKSEDEQSKRRLAAQKKLKAKAKKKAKLKLQQDKLQNQVLQQQQGYQANNLKQADRNIFRSPMSIQEQIMFPASPLASNSGHGNENPSIHSSLGISNPLNFFDGFHDGLYMPNENDFDDISFGNPTLISIPGLIETPNGEQNPHTADPFKLLNNQKQNDGSNNQKQNFFGFQDYTEIGKKHRQNGISFEDPLTSHPVSPPHTEILIGSLNGPKKLTSPNSGSDSKANKIRNYPTSIQDITRGKKMSNSYTVDPSFGRESPDNLFLSQPGKDSEPMLNQFKNGLTSNSKMTNEMNSWNGNNHRNNAQNFQTTPITLPWYQHEVDNLLKSNPGKSSSWDQGKQKSKQITNNFNQPVDQNLRHSGRDQRPVRFSTPKPISKQKMGFAFDEPLELITETPRELKPVDYPRLTWIEPEADKVKKRKQKKNKSKGLKNNKKSNNNVNSYQQQIQQLTDDMISIGFDSQRMRTPKAQDLLMRSSQIYPLIGGYSPFIMPSSASEDFNVTVDSDDEVEDDESMNHQDDDNQSEFGLDYVGDDRGKTEEGKKEAVEEIMMKSNNFNTNVNDDNGEDDEDNDDANVNQSESAKQKQQQQKNIPNDPELLIKDKINDENKAKSNYNLISKNERDPDKPSSSQIWSQPCPTCPEL
uniref:Uncharacterized protein n=2 Tax=Tetranychus urticae TaxID=32264 RepID=T1K3F6_TETUR